MDLTEIDNPLLYCYLFFITSTSIILINKEIKKKYALLLGLGILE